MTFVPTVDCHGFVLLFVDQSSKVYCLAERTGGGGGRGGGPGR